MAIVTGRSIHVETIIEQARLEDYFDQILTGSPDGNVKRDAILSILAKWDLEASEVILVGDTNSDMQVANSVGVVAVKAKWSQALFLDQATKPDCIEFVSVVDLRKWLEKNMP